LAIKRLIETDVRGLRPEDLIESVFQEFKEHEDLQNTTNPDDWARISGRKGERIVFIRTLIDRDDDNLGGKSIDGVTTGQYL
ncbi:MAG: proteasome ATPase, partial [Acidimicrobiaceae bacterium]|nr:proteasome ATPase [Acidimicrobiaceae bacterium]